MSALVFLPWLLPLLLLVMGWSRPRVLIRLSAWMPVVAIMVALVWVATHFEPLDLPWLFLGARLGLDTTGAALLFGSALVWLMGTLLAIRYLRARALSMRFFRFWLLAMAGGFGACVALDGASFYLFYALMGLSAWGLIDYHRNKNARQAGMVYLVLALLGEVLILVGLLFVSSGLTPLPAIAWIGLLVGFGIKVGLIGFHGILPLIYHAATVPAAMVLAGAMASVGFLGWVRFLPLGFAPEPFWGGVWMIAGTLAVVTGLVLGLLQTLPKAILGYSSVMQFGMLTFVIGATLADPLLWLAIAPLIIFYLVGHGWIKAVLFGASEYLLQNGTKYRYRIAGWLAALSLAGGPLSAGAAAKGMLKAPLAELGLAVGLFGLLSVGSMLLMIRFFGAIKTQRHGAPIDADRGMFDGLWWGMLVVVVLPWAGLVWSLDTLAPIVLAFVLAYLWRRLSGPKALGSLPPGDLMHGMGLLGAQIVDRFKKRRNRPPGALPKAPLPAYLWRIEERLATGVVWMGLFLAVVFYFVLRGQIG